VKERRACLPSDDQLADAVTVKIGVPDAFDGVSVALDDIEDFIGVSRLLQDIDLERLVPRCPEKCDGLQL
jgi:hypothetical protein